MLNLIFRISIIFFFFQNSNAIIKNKVIAKIDDEIISSYELKNKIKTILILSNQELNQQNIDKTKNLALKTLVNYKLKKIEVEKYNISTDSEAVANHLNNFYLKFNTDLNGFKRIFKINNIDFNYYLKEIENEFAWQNLVFKLYANKLEVNDSDIDRQLNEIIKKQKNVSEYELAEIEILIEKNLSSDQQIKEIENQIAKIGFENTAIKFSSSPSALEGGNIGWINSNAISKRILDIINEMNIGDVSRPLIQANSITFFKLLNKKSVEVDVKNLDRLRKTIINNNKNDMLNMYSNSHLSKIKNNAYINFK